MTKQQCQLCGEFSMEHTSKETEYRYKGHSIIVEQPGEYCEACGEAMLGPKDLSATRKQLAEFKAEVDHLLSPAEIRKIRRRLKLTQLAAARICGGGKNAFSRYESGEVLIPRAASNLLMILSNHKELMDEIKQEVA